MNLYRYLKTPIMMEIIIDTLPSVVLKTFDPENIRIRLIKQFDKNKFGDC